MESSAPKRAGLVLAALILVAAVANLNLAVANVALPDIGKAFDASQTTLNLVAVGYSLGLAASVLYLGALGDRYGRKMMLILGMSISIPASLLAGLAGSIGVLFAARLLGGVAAGMAFPTTLALITALWSGPARTRAIALWSALGGAIASLGPLLSGALLEKFDWGSVFLVTLPLAALALFMAWRFVPSHVNETTNPVDNPGGLLSIVMVATLVMGISLAPAPGKLGLAVGLIVIALATAGAFLLRQRRAPEPLYDLEVARRRIFWVAACAGIIVFGSLMAAMFVGQQFLQNVLGYSTLGAGAAILPAALLMVVVAPRSAKLVETNGARFTLLLGYAFCLLGFLTMLILWEKGSAYWQVALGYGLVGIGVGFAGTPASHSLTGSVPVHRAGMASATADLQRDLGGAVMQSILGALLTAGYAAAASSAIAESPSQARITESVENSLTKSFSSAADLASRYPEHSQQIVNAAQQSFLHGEDWAYTAGIIAVLIGAAIVFFLFPRAEEERELLGRYEREDGATEDPVPGGGYLALPILDTPGCGKNRKDEVHNPAMSYRVLKLGDAHWRRSNQMKTWNTDLGKQLEASALGARIWRLEPGQASTKHRHFSQEELYVLLEGEGRVRIDEELLRLAPLDALLVEPNTVRQLFNDTDGDQLWLIVGSPPEAITSTLEMSEEQLEFMYPDGPKALPPELEERG